MCAMYSDQELIKLILHEAPFGIEIAIEMYGGAVKTICREILKGFRHEDVEEAVADTFTALWKSVHNYDMNRGVCLKSYLYGIARRTALNKKRQLMRAELHLGERVTDVAVNRDVAAEIEKKLETELLRQLIIEQASPDREIFIKRYFLSMPVKEIADQLNLPVKTVENKLCRGKKRLKKQLIKRGVACE